MFPNIPVTKIVGEPGSFPGELVGIAAELSAWMEFAYWHAPVDGRGWPPEEGMCCGLMGRLFRLFARVRQAIEHKDFEAADIYTRCALESCFDLLQILDDESEDRAAFQSYRIGKVRQFRDVVLEHLAAETALSEEDEKRREHLLADKEAGAKTLGIDSLLKQKGVEPIARAILWNYPSQAIHGTHENLGTYHLKIEGERCFPISSSGSQPLRHHAEVIGVGIRTCGNYLAKQVRDVDAECFDRLIDLEARLTCSVQHALPPHEQS